MAKKRKSDATRLDEVDRTIYSTFCSAANSLSQLYTQAMNQQKLAFQAGERHGMEKIYQWILRQHEEGSRVAAADIVSYLQNELDYSGEDATMSPRLQHQHSQPTVHFTNPSAQVSSGSFGQATPFHFAQGGYYQNNVLATGNATARNQETNFHHQNRDSNNCNSNDSSMDMHEESPPHESY
ncbi:hypothetical protein MRB53_012025 [Persea americana]|uniref:Uncharacterized protein n=1 Tax=Persea americana TaxID=3435 RepID=A0ACC2LX24_PERAE|nr:hypothetical protein MRB53_012025 [Persea americana]